MSKPVFVSQPVVVTIGGVDFTFTPTVTDANNHTNSLLPNDKTAPAFTYLTRTVKPEQKDELVELLNTVPGLIMELFVTVSQASKGGIEVSLKK